MCALINPTTELYADMYTGVLELERRVDLRLPKVKDYVAALNGVLGGESDRISSSVSAPTLQLGGVPRWWWSSADRAPAGYVKRGSINRLNLALPPRLRAPRWSAASGLALVRLGHGACDGVPPRPAL